MDLVESEIECSNGYLAPAYAESLSEFGSPRFLRHCGGWLLQRRIPASEAADAMGCYPLFSCSDWSRMALDLDELKKDLVSVALVADPFGEYVLEDLKRSFEVVAHFKDHYECVLGQRPESFVTRHHRYYAKKALQGAQVEAVDDPREHLDEWTALYATLVKRHGLTGIKAFSRESFAKQLSVPGLVMLRITAGATCLGAHLWMIQNRVAYSHLMALSDAGYSVNASYGLYWRAIELFRSEFALAVERLNLGAGAGISANGADGLAQFKRGWSTGVRPALFCGRILDQAKYDELVRVKNLPAAPYFPLYRKGEFA